MDDSGVCRCDAELTKWDATAGACVAVATCLARSSFSSRKEATSCDKAALSFEEAARRNPDDDWIFVYLAGTYGQLGRIEEGAQAVARANLLRAKSGWGALTTNLVSHHREFGLRRYYFKWYGDYLPLKEGLRKAGVPPDPNWRDLVITKVAADGKESGIEIRGATSIDAETAKALHDRGVVFVDIFTQGRQQRIPGSYLLEEWFYQFNEVRMARIVDKTDEVVIYGSGDFAGAGRRAPQAVARAILWGYQNVYYFEDGLVEWKEAGYPVDSEIRLELPFDSE